MGDGVAVDGSGSYSEASSSQWALRGNGSPLASFDREGLSQELDDGCGEPLWLFDPGVVATISEDLDLAIREQTGERNDGRQPGKSVVCACYHEHAGRALSEPIDEVRRRCNGEE
jgi:hypothetical protein